MSIYGNRMPSLKDELIMQVEAERVAREKEIRKEKRKKALGGPLKVESKPRKRRK